MATTTPNLGLTLPGLDDQADIAVLNQNYTLIDTEAGKINANFMPYNLGDISSLADLQTAIETYASNTANMGNTQTKMINFRSQFRDSTLGISSGSVYVAALTRITADRFSVFVFNHTQLNVIRGIYAVDTWSWDVITTIDQLPSIAEYTLAMPEISAASNKTVTLSGYSHSVPKFIQIMDNASGFPYIATNWWLSDTTLSMQVYNPRASVNGAQNVQLRVVY